MNDQVTIVIADAQPIFLKGLRQTLDTVKNFDIVGEASDGKAVLTIINDTKPDIAILDTELPDKNGFDIARAVFARSLPVNIMFLTTRRSRSRFNAALNLGVKGYVLKDSATDYLIDAVRTVSSGNHFISPVLSDFLVKRSWRKKTFIENTPAVSVLTPCEKRILVFISQYMTSKDIAEELFISVRTVEHHRENIAAKLGLQGRYSLLKFALNHKDEL